MKQEIKPTRAELREIKRRIALVRRRHRLLKRKQEALMAEFFSCLDRYRALHREAAAAQEEAEKAVARAEMAAGPASVWSFSLSRAGRLGVSWGTRYFMGAALPEISIHAGPHPSLLPGEAVENHLAAQAAERLALCWVRLAGLEAALRALLSEIERTKRRVNALEIKLLPALEESQRFIQSHLEEMERESLFSLKRLRAKLASRAGK
ncbi:MAG: V-type ATP synthase subunit D [Planctomycetota bacterium]|nr:V-type ATP synthase subunit D [Planctomycetota bacterium]